MDNENNLDGFLSSLSAGIEKAQQFPIPHVSDYVSLPNCISVEQSKRNMQFEEICKENARKKEEQEFREIRNLEINERTLRLAEFRTFLMQSVTRDQKEMLEKIESLIDAMEQDSKIVESNMALIQSELMTMNLSGSNSNENFIQLIKSKMAEKGVETAIQYLFVGLELYLASK